MQQGITTNKKFYTTEEVAQIVGLSVGRVRELAVAGDITGYKPFGARRWRFSKQSVADYMGCTKEEI